MTELEKKFGAFLAQNHQNLQAHIELLIQAKDALESLRILKEKNGQQANQNRIVLYYNKDREYSILSDQPCEPYLIAEGDVFMQMESLKNRSFVGCDGVEEIFNMIRKQDSEIEQQALSLL